MTVKLPPFRDEADPIWERRMGELEKLEVTAAAPSAGILESVALKNPFIIASAQEKVETPTGFNGFEVGKINSTHFAMRGVWKTTAAIPAKTEFITLQAASVPASSRKAVVRTTTEAGAVKYVVLEINKAAAKVENETEIAEKVFIDFNGAIYGV